jgi:hypothetical protein
MLSPESKRQQLQHKLLPAPSLELDLHDDTCEMLRGALQPDIDSRPCATEEITRPAGGQLFETATAPSDTPADAVPEEVLQELLTLAADPFFCDKMLQSSFVVILCETMRTRSGRRHIVSMGQQHWTLQFILDRISKEDCAHEIFNTEVPDEMSIRNEFKAKAEPVPTSLCVPLFLVSATKEPELLGPLVEAGLAATMVRLVEARRMPYLVGRLLENIFPSGEEHSPTATAMAEQLFREGFLDSLAEAIKTDPNYAQAVGGPATLVPVMNAAVPGGPVGDPIEAAIETLTWPPECLPQATAVAIRSHLLQSWSHRPSQFTSLHGLRGLYDALRPSPFESKVCALAFSWASLWACPLWS